MSPDRPFRTRRQFLETGARGVLYSLLLTACGDLGSNKELAIQRNDTHVIYSANQDGNYNIFRKELESTSEPEQLTFGSSDKMNFQIAPDCTWGMYYSNEVSKTNPNGAYQLWKFDLIHQENRPIQLTSAVQEGQILDQHWYDPTISPDGNTIACKLDKLAINGHGKIYIMNRDGSNPQELVLKDKDGNEIYDETWKPAYSCDGKSLYVTVGKDNNSHIYKVNSDGSGVAIKLTPDDGFSHWFPAPHPNDNTKLLYVSNRNGSDQIYCIDVTGVQKDIQLTGGGNESGDPSYSSDGSKITFLIRIGDNYNVCTMNADGSNVKVVTQTPFKELSPIFSN